LLWRFFFKNLKEKEKVAHKRTYPNLAITQIREESKTSF
jgi:hypothetical protein